MNLPKNKHKNNRDWIKIAEEFERELNFWNCLGAIDGKHIMIQNPANSGSLYFNYKSFMILLVVLNANYEFNIVDVGEAGRQRDMRIVCWGKSYVK